MTGKILLVEDDQNDELLTIRALKKSNLKNEIEVVRDGEEAMNYLQALINSSNQELPDLILLDLNLPKFSGLDVLSFVKSKKELMGIPVVILTTSTQEKDLEKAYLLGANSYIQKPVDIQDFMTAIQKLEVYWFVINKKPKGIL